MDTEAQLPEITADELIAELERVEYKGSGGLRTEELAGMLGRSINWVQRRLHALKADGRLVVRKLRREGLDGQPRMMTVYSVKPSGVQHGPA